MIKTLQERNAINDIAQEIVTAKVMDLLEVKGVITDVARETSQPAAVAAPAQA